MEVRRIQSGTHGTRTREGRGRSAAARTAGVLLLAAALGAGAGACTASSDDAGTCRTGGDCPSGVCDAGICQAGNGSTGAAGGEGGSGDGGGSGGDGGGSASGGGSSEGGGGPICAPENDGEIRRNEVPLEAGFRASFLTTPSGSFDSRGTVEDGERVWDLDVDLDGDHLVLSQTLDPSEQWFGASFPDATYASRLADGSDLYGVFQATSDALLLLGVASQEDGLTRTELTYTPPVVILDFPLEEGKAWSTQTTTVQGLAQGIAAFYFEAYDDEVDARGTVKTPYGDFDALRVRVDLTRNVSGFITTQRTFAFVTECFGTIARLVSQENDTSPEFDDPSEVLRLSP